jgi:1,2-diacylglycerol-3-alpha-glucose alpha-1,2-galactosyltransferase
MYDKIHLEVIYMRKINMFSSADKVKGQGVGSATKEQVELVKEGLQNEFIISEDKNGTFDINHYHTIDLNHYFHVLFNKKKSVSIGAVHFLPETIQGSLRLPIGIRDIFYKYIISFYNKMDHLVTVNPYFKDELVKYGIDKDKIHYVPNYVSKEDFYPMTNSRIEKARLEYGLNKDDFVVLGVGQVQRRKGVIDFCEVARKNPDVKFIWAGGFSFGMITDGYDELKKVIDNPPENVNFIGIVDREKMNEIYNICDVYFMPSYNELFPMAILEAMNCEKPILLRDLDIYTGILDGYYVKACCNDSFSECIASLADDEDVYDAARQRSINGASYYSRENVLSQWQLIYNKVYDEKHKA